MRLTPNAVGLGLIFVMAVAMLVTSPINLTSEAKADELAGDELVLPTGEDLRAAAHHDPRAAIEAARHH